mmetsp:Transcript_35279/g.69622  ORF Transcript_35279/g.69622 Transcript_35279/m.69622 type:complete len:88 (-) Transcript_35279:700-963(-)
MRHPKQRRGPISQHKRAFLFVAWMKFFSSSDGNRLRFCCDTSGGIRSGEGRRRKRRKKAEHMDESLLLSGLAEKGSGKQAEALDDRE